VAREGRLDPGLGAVDPAAPGGEVLALRAAAHGERTVVGHGARRRAAEGFKAARGFAPAGHGGGTARQNAAAPRRQL